MASHTVFAKIRIVGGIAMEEAAVGLDLEEFSLVGMIAGIGSSLSTTFFSYVAVNFGSAIGFVGVAGVALSAVETALCDAGNKPAEQGTTSAPRKPNRATTKTPR